MKPINIGGHPACQARVLTQLCKFYLDAVDSFDPSTLSSPFFLSAIRLASEPFTNFYEYCRDHGINPFIDLNGKGGYSTKYKGEFTINEKGVPICREGEALNKV